MTTRVGINGFGRIGRNFFRAAKERGADLEFVAANDLGSVELMAHLLKYDSILGTFDADVEVVGDGIKVDGDTITILAERDPAALPWGELGVDVVVESTGLFTERDKAAKHLDAGAPIVVISAPGKGVDATFVVGVNDDTFDPERHKVDLERVVHHELLRADGQGPRRRVRHREGADDDGPRVHRHAGADRRTGIEGSPRGAGGGDQRDPVLHRRRARDRHGPRGDERPARRPVAAGARARRFDHRLHGAARLAR